MFRGTSSCGSRRKSDPRFAPCTFIIPPYLITISRLGWRPSVVFDRASVTVVPAPARQVEHADFVAFYDRSSPLDSQCPSGHATADTKNARERRVDRTLCLALRPAPARNLAALCVNSRVDGGGQFSTSKCASARPPSGHRLRAMVPDGCARNLANFFVAKKGHRYVPRSDIYGVYRNVNISSKIMICVFSSSRRLFAVAKG
jgi:hypothetical protein